MKTNTHKSPCYRIQQFKTILFLLCPWCQFPGSKKQYMEENQFLLLSLTQLILANNIYLCKGLNSHSQTPIKSVRGKKKKGYGGRDAVFTEHTTFLKIMHRFFFTSPTRM